MMQDDFNIKKKAGEIIRNSPRKNPYVTLINNYTSILTSEEDIFSKKGSWKEELTKDNISIEIGCGSGNFLNKMAEQNPNSGFIGIEIRYKRLVLAANKSEKSNSNNILWIKTKAENVDRVFEDREVNNIHIYFPDPWPKRKHKKNRLLKEIFFKKLSKILKKDGKIFFKSDHDEYFDFVSNIVKSIDGIKILEEDRDFYKNREIEEDATEFERLFYNKGKNINYLKLKKL